MTTITKLKPKQISLVTSIATPGEDTNIPTEKAVRDALDAIEVSLIQHSQTILSIEGYYLAASNQGVKGIKVRIPYVGEGAVIEEVYLQLASAPVTQALRVGILKNGSTIFSGTTYMEIATSQTGLSRITNFVDGGALAKDDYLQLQLVQGDASASSLLAHIRYYWTLTDS